MTDAPIRELEWFDLETRLREIIYQQLEVFNKRAREDREASSLISSNVQGLEKRISMLETSVFGDSDPQSVLSDIHKKISDVEGLRKRDVVRFDQETVNFKEKFKALQFQITGNTEMIKRVEILQEDLSKDIEKVKTIVEDHQTVILKEIDKFNTHFKEMNANYLDKGMKIEEKINSTLVRLDDIGLGLQKYDRQFESIKKNLNDIYITINLLKTNKLEYETFETERNKNDIKLQELIKDSQDFRSAIASRDLFIDKFVPLQTVSLLSDALHSSLDTFAKKRLAEYEKNLLKSLHQAALEIGSIMSREEAIEKILENIRHVEQRKTDLLIEKPKENPQILRPTDTKSPSKQPIQEKYHENYATKEEMINTFEKYCEQKLEPLVNKTKSEILEKYEQIKKTITSTENECMLYTQQVLTELEDLKNKEMRDMNQVETLYSQAKDEENVIKASLNHFSNVIESTSQMLVCLVENAQIDLALSAQEEELRQENSENAFIKPRVQETLQKKSMSFITGTGLLPLRQQQIKQPPLMYRSKRFTRAELVEMKGKMLKMCWDSVSKNIPWRQDEFEYIISEAVKSLKITSSEDSQMELPQQSLKESLPLMVSPSIRTRTPNIRKTGNIR
jgi:hypothetical protein